MDKGTKARDHNDGLRLVKMRISKEAWKGRKGPETRFLIPLWSAIWSGRYNVTEVFEMESDVVRLDTP